MSDYTRRKKFLALGEGEICTLENMGPIWIHINLSQQLEGLNHGRPKDMKRVEALRRRHFTSDKRKYRICRLEDGKALSSWLGPYEVLDFIVEELGLESAKSRPGFYLKEGRRIQKKYVVEVSSA